LSFFNYMASFPVFLYIWDLNKNNVKIEACRLFPINCCQACPDPA